MSDELLDHLEMLVKLRETIPEDVDLSLIMEKITLKVCAKDFMGTEHLLNIDLCLHTLNDGVLSMFKIPLTEPEVLKISEFLDTWIQLRKKLFRDDKK